MQELEMSAKTVEEAIEIALKQLDVGREEVDIVVVSEGKSGILGIGSEPARIRVTPLHRIPEEAALAREILETIIKALDVSVVVHLREMAERQRKFSPTSLALDIQGEDTGLLIGRRGETLSALQFLVNFMVSHRLKNRVSIMVDVEGYRQRRQESLQALALRIAERVKTSRRTFILEPMSPSDRRIIHLALAEHPDVTTQSMGEGNHRKVTILPKKQ